jgi:hypothetical protein
MVKSINYKNWTVDSKEQMRYNDNPREGKSRGKRKAALRKSNVDEVERQNLAVDK